MRRLSLSTLLAGLNVGLLLLAVLGVAVLAVRLLRQLADEQALARVTQAGASAHNLLTHAGEELARDAQLLSERPTLERLLRANDRRALSDFLEQFRQTSQLTGNAVWRNAQLVAHSNDALPWAALRSTAALNAPYFFYAEADQWWLGAHATLSALPEAEVVTVLALDADFARRVSAEVGLPVRLISPLQVSNVSWQTQVWQSGTALNARFEAPDRYLAVWPVSSTQATVVGLIETELSATPITESVELLVQNFLWLTVGMAGLATVGSWVLGRRLARPLRQLSEAATRIGLGDLTTPIVKAPSAEIGTLSLTLEEMRHRLQQLTLTLRREQAETNAILIGITEGVLAVDTERRIQYLNPSGATLLGTSTERALGRFCGDVLNPRPVHGVRPCEARCPIIMARVQTQARAIEHACLPNGQIRALILTSAPPAPLEDRADVPRRQVLLFRDETEVEATRRLRDTILANISHEFRTPLSAQLASLELLLDQLPDLTTEQIAELLLSLQRGTLRLTQLIDNLLESVRLEAGQTAIRRQPVALDAIVEDALEMTRPLFLQRQQTVTVELPYPLPALTGDAPRLTQVFVNLLANANKFAPPETSIQIGGALGAQMMTVWVEDHGPGLPPNIGAQLFAPFTRSLSDEPEAGGVGLGLWIVKSIIERHGGRVAAHSHPDSVRIELTLPIK